MNLYCNCTNQPPFDQDRIIHASTLFNLPFTSIWMCWNCFQDKLTFGGSISLEDVLGFTEADLHRPE